MIRHIGNDSESWKIYRGRNSAKIYSAYKEEYSKQFEQETGGKQGFCKNSF